MLVFIHIGRPQLDSTSEVVWKAIRDVFGSKREHTVQEFSKQPLHGYIVFIENRVLVPDSLWRTLSEAASENDGPQRSANELGRPATVDTHLSLCFRAAKRNAGSW